MSDKGESESGKTGEKSRAETEPVFDGQKIHSGDAEVSSDSSKSESGSGGGS